MKEHQSCRETNQRKTVSVITLGDEDRIHKDAKRLDVDLTGVRIINPTTSDKLSDFTNIFFNLRKHKGVTIEQARAYCSAGLIFCCYDCKRKYG